MLHDNPEPHYPAFGDREAEIVQFYQEGRELRPDQAHHLSELAQHRVDAVAASHWRNELKGPSQSGDWSEDVRILQRLVSRYRGDAALVLANEIEKGCPLD